MKAQDVATAIDKATDTTTQTALGGWDDGHGNQNMGTAGEPIDQDPDYAAYTQDQSISDSTLSGDTTAPQGPLDKTPEPCDFTTPGQPKGEQSTTTQTGEQETWGPVLSVNVTGTDQQSDQPTASPGGAVSGSAYLDQPFPGFSRSNPIWSTPPGGMTDPAADQAETQYQQQLDKYL